MTDRTEKEDRRRAIVDQTDDVRDPADDSGEADDPTAVVEVYPEAFDHKIEEAEKAIAEADGRDGTASR